MKNIILSFFCILLFSCNTKAQNNQKETTDSKKSKFPISKTDAEWKSELSESEYYVLRKAGTERPFSSDLLEIKEAGTYVCAACATPLFRSEHKFLSLIHI